jgi:hypothetical protein
MLETTIRDKRSNLLQKFIIYGLKSYIRCWPDRIAVLEAKMIQRLTPKDRRYKTFLRVMYF